MRGQIPFTHTFGVKPEKSFISPEIVEEIVENFSYDNPSEKVYLLTGVRGSGKTVAMDEISARVDADKYIVCDLNPAKDMVLDLTIQLSEDLFLKSKIISAKIDISILGLNIDFDAKIKPDVEMILRQILELAKKHKKEVLIKIDEVSPTENFRLFALTFQSLIRDTRKRYSVNLIMTAVKQNYIDMINKDEFKDCTFLTRAYEKTIRPLEIAEITLFYKRILGISREEASKYAKLTNGYAYAYQVLGYILFTNLGEAIDEEDLIMEYEAELGKYSYSKIWSEMSEKDIEVVKALIELDAHKHKVKRKELMEHTKISSTTLNTYKTRLAEKGIIETSDKQDGYYSIILPRFAEYLVAYKF